MKVIRQILIFRVLHEEGHPSGLLGFIFSFANRRETGGVSYCIVGDTDRVYDKTNCSLVAFG